MHGPTCIFWANLTPSSLEQAVSPRSPLKGAFATAAHVRKDTEVAARAAATVDIEGGRAYGSSAPDLGGRVRTPATGRGAAVSIAGLPSRWRDPYGAGRARDSCTLAMVYPLGRACRHLR